MEDNKFGEALSALIDKTNVFTRAQWASYLFVSTSAISQWVQGKTIPRADYLKSILHYLEKFDKQLVKEKIYNFYAIADLPLEKVMPSEQSVKIKGAATISDYISSTYMVPLSIEINNLPGTLRKDFIFLCTEFCRKVQKLSSKDDSIKHIEIVSSILREIEEEKLESLLKGLIEPRQIEADVNTKVYLPKTSGFIMPCRPAGQLERDEFEYKNKKAHH